MFKTTAITLALIALASSGAQAKVRFSVHGLASAHEQMLARVADRDTKRANKALRDANKPPRIIHTGMPPPDSAGRAEHNALGTVYCGVKGCWR